MYSRIRIINIYSCGTQHYQLEYSAYIQFLPAFSLESSTHFQSYLGQYPFLLPPSVMFHAFVIQLDSFVYIPSLGSPSFLYDFLNSIYIKFHTLCFKSLYILTYVMYPLLHYFVVRVTALKIALCFPYLAHSSSFELLATTDHFTVFADLPFPECHIIGIIQYVAFSDWLLILSTMHPSFIHVFCGLMLISFYC